MTASTAPSHIPVMLDEVLAALAPKPGEQLVDGTFGAGGYSRAIIETGATVTAIDRDPAAIEAGKALVAESGGLLELLEGRFSQMDELVNGPVDGVVLDVGVSSMQIDQAERGFSFQKDGPLDMRMGREGFSAADAVNLLPRAELTRVIGLLGEERHASRISRAIAERRARQPFETTLDLARVVEAAAGRHPRDRINPATRTFQALRIFVNRELDELADALLAAERILGPGGRLAVVSFHSLEDRLVKKFLASRTGGEGGSRHLPQADAPPATFAQTRRGAIAASAAEAAANPRARSAKLRTATRTETPARAADRKIFGMPDLSGAYARMRSETAGDRP